MKTAPNPSQPNPFSKQQQQSSAMSSMIESQEVVLEPEDLLAPSAMKTSVNLVRRWQFVNKLIRHTHTTKLKEKHTYGNKGIEFPNTIKSPKIASIIDQKVGLTDKCANLLGNATYKRRIDERSEQNAMRRFSKI